MGWWTSVIRVLKLCDTNKLNVDPSDGRILLYWRSFGFRSDGVEGGFCFFVSLGFAVRKKSLTSSPCEALKSSRFSKRANSTRKNRKGLERELYLRCWWGWGRSVHAFLFYFFLWALGERQQRESGLRNPTSFFSWLRESDFEELMRNEFVVFWRLERRDANLCGSLCFPGIWTTFQFSEVSHIVFFCCGVGELLDVRLCSPFLTSRLPFFLTGNLISAFGFPFCSIIGLRSFDQTRWFCSAFFEQLLETCRRFT